MRTRTTQFQVSTNNQSCISGPKSPPPHCNWRVSHHPRPLLSRRSPQHVVHSENIAHRRNQRRAHRRGEVRRWVHQPSCEPPSPRSIRSATNHCGTPPAFSSQLYSGAFNNSFNDIVNGTNPACGTDGFSAALGWDPVTGRGTVNFENLLSAFMELK